MWRIIIRAALSIDPLFTNSKADNSSVSTTNNNKFRYFDISALFFIQNKYKILLVTQAQLLSGPLCNIIMGLVLTDNPPNIQMLFNLDRNKLKIK